MNRQISFGQYRAIDLSILSVLLVICQFLTHLATSFWFPEQLLMQLGRAALAAALGFPGAACLGFITTDILSILFTVFIVWTVRRIEGLFEDQKNYLLRIQKEQQVERGEQF